MPLGEGVGMAVVTAATEEATRGLISRYGFGALESLRTLIGALRRTHHPSLDDLREICDYLQALLPQPCGSVNQSFKFPDVQFFTRRDMSPKEIAQLWFRMDKLNYEMKGVIDKWISAGDDRQPYFFGTANFDYGDDKVQEPLRHPVFRSVHPFIMLFRAERKTLSEDPIGDTLSLFIDSWWAFVQPGYTEFRLGKVVQVENQGFAEGYITITNKSQFRWKEQYIAENITLWRCVMVTARPDCVDTMNVGIPRSEISEHGREYIQHFKDWMREFMAQARAGKH
jgi:hypothetical protein